jgi:hypothetical protein
MFAARISTALHRTNFWGFSLFHPGFSLFCCLGVQVSKGRNRGRIKAHGGKIDLVTQQRLLAERHVVLQPWSTGHLSLWIHSSNIHPDTRVLRVLLLPSHRSHRIRHNMALLLLRASTASDNNNDCRPEHSTSSTTTSTANRGTSFATTHTPASYADTINAAGGSGNTRTGGLATGSKRQANLKGLFTKERERVLETAAPGDDKLILSFSAKSDVWVWRRPEPCKRHGECNGRDIDRVHRGCGEWLSPSPSPSLKLQMLGTAVFDCFGTNEEVAPLGR